MHSTVSVITPMRNATRWLDSFFASIQLQQILCSSSLSLELSIFDDATDLSDTVTFSFQLLTLLKMTKEKNFRIVISGHNGPLAKGCGFGKNFAVKQSTGDLLVFADADDMMLPERLTLMLKKVNESQLGERCCMNFGRFFCGSSECRLHEPKPPCNANILYGSFFIRRPLDAMNRYSTWANSLCNNELYTQCLTPHGPGLIMPTWVMSRKTFTDVGYFSEDGYGCPEDLDWYLRHMFDKGGECELDEHAVVVYTYHQTATTFSVLDDTILALRLRYFEKYIAPEWPAFCLWGYRYARHVFKAMSTNVRNKITAFLDIRPRVIGQKYLNIPILHWSSAKPPILVCVKRDLTGGKFEENLKIATSGLVEGSGFLHFA